MQRRIRLGLSCRGQAGVGPSFEVRHSRASRLGARRPRGYIRSSGDRVRVTRPGAGDNDVARLLLALALQGLPADRADWAQAMLVSFGADFPLDAGQWGAAAFTPDGS